MKHARLIPFLVVMLGQAVMGQQELPLNVAVEGQVDPGGEFAEYLFSAPKAGILTVAARGASRRPARWGAVQD